MESIDVHDLPEIMAEAVAESVQNLRDQLKRSARPPVGELPTWNLGVIGTLSREEIYDYLDDERTNPD